jgi:uncharacterized protein (DUF885 family)
MAMTRSTAVCLALIFALCGSCQPRGGHADRPPPGTEPLEADLPTRATALADEYWKELRLAVPILETFFGLPDARHDRLPDNSFPALRRWEAKEDAWARQLAAMDLDRLRGRPEFVTTGIIRELVETSRQSRVCHSELWGVNQLNGWQNFFSVLAQLQPVGTLQLRGQLLARWRAIPGFLDQEIANLRVGVKRGYTAPRGNVEAVIEQLDGMLAPDPSGSPFYAPALRDSTPEFARQLADVVGTALNPAIRRYREYLATEYLPSARRETAVTALPDGVACYRAKVRGYVSLDLPPEEIHRLGLQQMRRIEAEMRLISQRSFNGSELPALLQKLRTDSQYTFRNKEEIVQLAEAAYARGKTAMPRWFGRLPKADMIVDPCLPFEEKSGCPGSYIPAASDGSRPGRYRINTSEPTSQSRSPAEAVAFHEGIPGHHLQGSIGEERPNAHPITRYLFSTGFGEGWALYAEQLAEEMGLYSSDLDRMGRLSNDALRAARLVVDPGLHVLGWSRQQAINYLLAHTAESDASATSEVDRYIIDPGQATAYMIGRLEIERLRKNSEQRLGRDFDIRAFHDRVLEDGAVTLPMLRDKIKRWLAGGAGSHRALSK